MQVSQEGKSGTKRRIHIILMMASRWARRHRPSWATALRLAGGASHLGLYNVIGGSGPIEMAAP